MAVRINFKLDFNGETHRFCSTLANAELFRAIKTKVASIVNGEGYELYWRDEDSNVVLASPCDLSTAIEYAKFTRKSASKPPCVQLTVKKPTVAEEQVAAAAQVGEAETQSSLVAKIIVGAIPDGVVHLPVHFFVDASSAGIGNLRVVINDGRVPSMACGHGKDRYDISFVPREVIDHTISILFNNEHVTGSPFICRITVPVLRAIADPAMQSVGDTVEVAAEPVVEEENSVKEDAEEQETEEESTDEEDCDESDAEDDSDEESEEEEDTQEDFDSESEDDDKADVDVDEEEQLVQPLPYVQFTREQLQMNAANIAREKERQLQERERELEMREETLLRRMAEFAVTIEQFEEKMKELSERVEEIEKEEKDDDHEKGLDAMEERLKTVEEKIDEDDIVFM